jgi:DNA-binding transcriptional MerR regulator
MDLMMSQETLYTIGELADLAGVTPRTIRYYTAEGLLPRPDARGQYALYGEEHLLRLQLIARLKAAYLPLSEIKAQIQPLDLDQVREFLEEYPDPPEPEPTTSAADYLSQLMARQQAATLSNRQTLEGRAAASMPRMQAFAMPPEEDSPTQPPSATPPYGFAEPASMPPPAPAPAGAQPGLLRKLIPQRRAPAEPEPPAAPPAAEERWRRVSLAPGVELHVREPLAPTVRERVERLLVLARDLFSGD